MGRLDRKFAIVTGAGGGIGLRRRDASMHACDMTRLCEPDDVANAALFLASDEAAYVNGTTLMVEGGASVYLPSTRNEATERR